MVNQEDTNVTDEERELVNAVLVDFLGEEGGIAMSKGYDFKMQLAKEGLEEVKKANSTLKQRIDSLRFATGNMELVSDVEEHCDNLVAELETKLKDTKHLDYGKLKGDTRIALAVVRKSITDVDSQLNNMMEDDGMNNQTEVTNNTEVEVIKTEISEVITEAVEATADPIVIAIYSEEDDAVITITAEVTPEATASQATDSNNIIVEDKDMEVLTAAEEEMRDKLVNEAIDDAIDGTEDFSEDDFDDEIGNGELTEEETVKLTQRIKDALTDLKDFIPTIGDNLEKIRHMTYTDAYAFIKAACVRHMILFKNAKNVKRSTNAVKKAFGYIKGLFVKLIRKVAGKKAETILQNIKKVNMFIGETLKKVAGFIVDGVILISTIAIKVTYSLISLAFRSAKKLIKKGNKKDDLDDLDDDFDDDLDDEEYDDYDGRLKAATDAVLAGVK